MTFSVWRGLKTHGSRGWRGRRNPARRHAFSTVLRLGLLPVRRSTSSTIMRGV